MPTTPNIVGSNNVVTCCVRLHGPSDTTKLKRKGWGEKKIKVKEKDKIKERKKDDSRLSEIVIIKLIVSPSSLPLLLFWK